MEDSVFWITIDGRAPDHSWLIIRVKRDGVFVSLRDQTPTSALLLGSNLAEDS